MDALGDVWWFLLGTVLVLLVIDSALRTFVLPRAATPVITRGVFGGLRILFDRMARFARTYSGRDHVMALYAPVGLVVLPLVWLCMEVAAFTAYFRALGVDDIERAFEMSGSSMFTLGFVRPPDVATVTLAFVEAASGLALLALLIAYLPTIYGAFSRREVQVAQLAVRAGEPPSGVNVLARAQSMERFTLLTDLWVIWQQWFAEVEETHTSLGVLSFFRSPLEHRSWVTAAGAVLDAAALRQSVVDVPPDPEAAMCIRSGFFALRSIAAYFGIGFDPEPFPTDPISIAEDEFEDACERLVAAGVPVRADREQAWLDFRGWRVNYDRVLIALAALVMAPYAPWSSDRSLRYRRHAFRRGSSLGTDG